MSWTRASECRMSFERSLKNRLSKINAPSRRLRPRNQHAAVRTSHRVIETTSRRGMESKRATSTQPRPSRCSYQREALRGAPQTQMLRDVKDTGRLLDL